MGEVQSILLYAESDSGKSAQLAELIKWHHEHTGEITRVIYADSTIDPLLPLLITPERPEGIVEAFNVKGMKDAWSRMELAARGKWFKPMALPGGGFNINMIDPLVKDGKLIHPASQRVIGMYGIEGLSTLSELLLQDHADHADSRPMWGSGKEGVSMFESKTTVEHLDGKMEQVSTKIGRAVGGHYGSVQKWILEVLIPRFSELRLINRVVWTAHTARGKDEFTGMEGKALGPATVGQASVDKTTRKFAHSFHLEVQTEFDKNGNAQREFRAWFISHPDQELKTLKWPAKVSVPIEKAKELLRVFPKGYIPLGDKTLGSFLDVLYSKEGK